MTDATIRRLAASIIGIGESKIWLDPNARDKISEALTRDDVRALIKDGVIKAMPRMGVCRLRARIKSEGKKVGRRTGHGSRKGSRSARQGPKSVWMAKVRAQRSLLSSLVAEGKLDKSHSKQIYMKIKGNSFRGRQNLVNYLKENDLIASDVKAAKK
ncbi:MAG: 50S ribosomal protein L19e [Candidatus Micrarchaeia archaeon]